MRGDAMTIYTVHLPDDPAEERSSRLMRAELVKDGFHWLALIFPLLWLLFNRIWWGLLAYIALVVAIAAGGWAIELPDGTIGALQLLIGLFLGIVGGELKSWQLRRRGLPAVDVVSGSSKEEAERRFFDRLLGRRAEGPPAHNGSGHPAPPARPQAPNQPVLGLFPEAGGAR
jgi:hypothetical protein